VTNVIGIIRVSETKGREERIVSPDEQDERLRDACKRDGKTLIAVHRELDVSGGSALSRRPGLLAALEAVERGEADEIMAAYFDRLFRSLKVQAEVTERVEKAGGRVLTLDFGELRNGTATEWVSASVVGMLAEYQTRSARERAGAAQARLVGEGKIVWPKPPWGYERNDDGTLRVDESLREIIVEAFARRAAGETIASVRRFLAAQRHRRSTRSVQIMLASAAYVGELHFGKLVNRNAWEAIVERHVWDAVQATRVPSGRTAKSDLLLARQRVLRCASCGGRMVGGGQVYRYVSRKTGSVSSGRYAFYRCGASDGDCSARCSISAEKLDALVIEHVKAIYAGGEGRASQARKARAAAARAKKARAKLATAKRRMLLLPDGEDDADALAVIDELNAQLHADEAEAQRQASLGDVAVTDAATILNDPDPEALGAKRALIRLALASITVRPGRAPVEKRVSVEPLR
jgi:DNA invertase Pin-like site-specific DNA recombinase